VVSYICNVFNAMQITAILTVLQAVKLFHTHIIKTTFFKQLSNLSSQPMLPKYRNRKYTSKLDIKKKNETAGYSAWC